MKQIRILIVIFCAIFIGAFSAKAQTSFTYNNGLYVPLAMDSLQPVTLTFADSLHGYFAAYKVMQDPFTFWVTSVLYWYRTSDGGRSWLPMSVGKEFGKDIVYSGNGNIIYYGPFGSSPAILTGSPLTAYINKSQPDYAGHQVADSGLYKTTNGGETWERITVLDILKTYEVFASLSPTLLIGYAKSQRQLSRSFNGGKTFVPIQNDKLFIKSVYPYDSLNGCTIADIRFDYSDDDHWIAVLAHGCDYDSNALAEGITCLLTSDGGQSWEKSTYGYNEVFHLDGFWSRTFSGFPQYVKGTPNLYIYPNTGHEGIAGKINVSYTDFNAGISFLYSTDYGHTWVADSSYHTRRRAFEPVGAGEVYETICRNDTLRELNYADLLIHTTNNGKNWDIDSTALNVPDFYRFDGRILTSDGTHLWCCAFQGLKTWLIRFDLPKKTVGVVEQKQNSNYPNFFKIYPNPLSDKTTFQILPSQEIVQVDVFDLLGRKNPVTYKVLAPNKIEVDTHTLSSGIYLTKVLFFDHGYGIYNGKFFVQ